MKKETVRTISLLFKYLFVGFMAVIVLIPSVLLFLNLSIWKAFLLFWLYMSIIVAFTDNFDIKESK